MDSLLASYASSDEEEEHQQHVHVGIPSNNIASSTTSSYGFSSLPQPKSSPSLTFSLPPPKSHLSTTQKPPLSQTQTPIFDTNNHVPEEEEEEERISDSSFQFGGNPKPTSRLFSSLPDPKSNLSNTQTLTPIMSSSSSSDRNLNKKVVVLLKPPMVNQSSIKSYSATDDDDDEVEEEDDKLTKRRKETESFSSETPSVKSFLSSIPAPKNSLGALPASLGSSGRRSIIIDADAPTSRVEEKNEATDNYNNHTSTGNDGENWVDGSSTSAAYGALDGHSGSAMTGGDPSSWNQGNENHGNYGNYDTTTYYESYGSVGQYDNNSFDGSVTAMPEMTQSFVKTHFKRGRNEVPTDIVEVKQDELMKNRPREDQVKLTGIAFGPSYQPASTKGKPTKLHKRKHQIGSLYFDMKQKEMELSERRAKGFLTKAETQAKYGW